MPCDIPPASCAGAAAMAGPGRGPTGRQWGRQCGFASGKVFQERPHPNGLFGNQKEINRQSNRISDSSHIGCLFVALLAVSRIGMSGWIRTDLMLPIAIET